MTTLPGFRPPDDFSRYERPAAWLCGRACEGRRCVSGPAPSGRCLEADEPCVPRRSLRSQRRIFVMACTIFSLAALLVMLSKACWTEAFAPGPLTLKHAQILSKSSTSNRCAACHEAGDKSFGDWAMHLAGRGSLQTPQSTLCLKCHEKGLDSAHALLPHGVAPERLAKHTLEVAGEGGGRNGSSAVSTPRNQRGEIGCAACHREHHGKDHDLAALSNQQCQTCHAKSFHSFASGHPEFTSWPFKQRSPIAFDHAGHKGKHFPAGKQEFRCAMCHVDDNRRDVKLLAGFQTACASCHEPKIKQSGEEGFKLFALPGMNVAALAEAGIGIGEWPEGISHDFDGVIPPAMARLLAAEGRGAKALARIPDGDLSAVDSTNKEQLAAAAEVALASKRLLHELAGGGERAFARRLNLVSGDSEQLWAQLPPDLLRTAQAVWLPKLNEEMVLLREGQPLPGSVPTASAPPAVIKEPALPVTKPDQEEDLLVPESKKPEGDDDLLGGTAEPMLPQPDVAAVSPSTQARAAGWSRSNVDYSIAWRPTGHGDPLLKAWIELALKTDARNPSAIAALRASLTKATSIGYCAQCHSIDKDSAGNLAIHWRTSPREPANKGFTKFSHRPHLIQPQLADCMHCHELTQGSGVVTGFAPLTKSACASCHVPTAAGDQCLKCHNYHVGKR